jgi:UDP-glucose 4-epimerase
MRAEAPSAPRRVLVTGALGLLGREVVRALAAAGMEVVALDLKAPAEPTGAAATIVDDLSSRERIEQVLAGIDAVVHLAAIAHLHAAREDIVYATNVITTANLLLAAEAMGVARLVFASSQAALGLAYAPRVIAPDWLPVDEEHPCRPLDGYGLSKLAGEQLAGMIAARSRVGVTSLRFPVIWAPERFAEHTGKRLGDPAQGAKSQWAYIDVRDAARACLVALRRAGSGHAVFNIAAPWPFAMDDPAALVRRWYGDVARAGWRPGDAVFDSRRAEQSLGFKARWHWSRDGMTDAPAGARLQEAADDPAR